MQMIDLIEKKQANLALTKEEINWLITNYVDEKIPEYQMSAFLMAVYFNGMTHEEVSDLTLAMAESGDQIDLSSIEGIVVDKHSTGGVGDTTTIVLCPLVASCGVPMAKMSGRGLGHTGGTVDKMETIPGFQVELTEEHFIKQVNEIGVALTGQTGNITPADKKIYALRDVTGTVQSIPLIASSIMSKKIAAGTDAIVLDVKVGDGAFMKAIEDAEELATTMVEIGKNVGRKTLAVVSDMNQPLGYAVGNVLEVKEAIATLKGEGPKDLTELCLTLGSQMLLAAEVVDSFDEGVEKLKAKIADGSAYNTFVTWLEHQGADTSFLDDLDNWEVAPYIVDVKAEKSGYIADWHAQSVGEVGRMLGAGRLTLEDELDPKVGIVLEKKVGDKVEEGDIIARIHSSKADNETFVKALQEAVSIEDSAEPLTLIHELIGVE